MNRGINKPQKKILGYNLSENHINGYFVIIANSRSGHNFIKNNLFSYLNDEKCETRKYVNLENRDPSLYEIRFNENEKSIHVLSTRCLLNWYSSILHFILKKHIIVESEIHYNEKYYYEKNKKADNLENRIVMREEEVKGDPEILANPKVLILRKSVEFPVLKFNSGKMCSIEEYTNKTVNNYLNSWLKIAKEFKNDTSYVPNFTKVYYDDFVIDENYRRSVCEEINGEYNETMINVVSANGGGSSFDKQIFDGYGLRMKVLERYKQWSIEGLKDTGLFLSYLKTHEAYKFYLNNFDVSQDKLDYMRNI